MPQGHVTVWSSECGRDVAATVSIVDQLNKTDAPLIPEAYIYFLGVQSLVWLCDGLAGYAIPLYNAHTLAVQYTPCDYTCGKMRRGILAHVI
jgi:hypothetical protein